MQSSCDSHPPTQGKVTEKGQKHGTVVRRLELYFFKLFIHQRSSFFHEKAFRLGEGDGFGSVDYDDEGISENCLACWGKVTCPNHKTFTLTLTLILTLTLTLTLTPDTGDKSRKTTVSTTVLTELLCMNSREHFRLMKVSVRGEEEKDPILTLTLALILTLQEYSERIIITRQESHEEVEGQKLAFLSRVRICMHGIYPSEK